MFYDIRGAPRISSFWLSAFSLAIHGFRGTSKLSKSVKPRVLRYPGRSENIQEPEPSCFTTSWALRGLPSRVTRFLSQFTASGAFRNFRRARTLVFYHIRSARRFSKQGHESLNPHVLRHPERSEAFQEDEPSYFTTSETLRSFPRA